MITVNAEARRTLPNCKLVVVPGAGHLFTEGDTFTEMLEYACDWFERTLGRQSSTQVEAPSPTAWTLRDLEISARSLTPDGLDELVDSLANSKVVLLGESTHGTEEFYRIRREISERLIEKHGFDFIAVEGDWPSCRKLGRYARHGHGESARLILAQLHRWPTWMWANEQVDRLLEWMRGREVDFYGLDLYSLYESIAEIQFYLRGMPADLRRRVLEAYSCFEGYDRNELGYARSLYGNKRGCGPEALEAWRALTRAPLRDLKPEEVLDVRQNAFVVLNAERYYCSQMHSDLNPWNIRDEHMTNTLLTLLDRHGTQGKGIVWAHNTHIGVRQPWVYSIGTSTYPATLSGRHSTARTEGAQRLRSSPKHGANHTRSTPQSHCCLPRILYGLDRRSWAASDDTRRVRTR